MNKLLNALLFAQLAKKVQSLGSVYLCSVMTVETWLVVMEAYKVVGVKQFHAF